MAWEQKITVRSLLAFNYSWAAMSPLGGKFERNKQSMTFDSPWAISNARNVTGSYFSFETTPGETATRVILVLGDVAISQRKHFKNTSCLDCNNCFDAVAVVTILTVSKHLFLSHTLTVWNITPPSTAVGSATFYIGGGIRQTHQYGRQRRLLLQIEARNFQSIGFNCDNDLNYWDECYGLNNKEH